MTKINNLFLKSSYEDLKANYEKVLNGEEKSWDVIVLTASNLMQAKTYELQLKKRKQENLLPKNIDFLVIPDLNDERIGSGGATLNVLVTLGKKYDLSKIKVLIIHSGGDSKRVPQYSCYGKLFSPVPCELSKFKSSTLFDETIMIMSDFPKRMNYGIFIMCGDSLVLFNQLQVDLQYKKAAVISMKMPVQMGEKHGVFVSDRENIVKEFLHKQPLRILEQKTAENGFINFDTGMIYFNYEIVKELLDLVKIQKEFNLFVSSKSRLNIYGDFLYPLASNSTLDNYYKQGCEFEFNNELRECRTKIWNKLRQYKLNIVKLSPSLFLHFGTTKELLEIMTDKLDDYEYLNWKDKTASFYDIENTITGNRIYLENSNVINSNIGDNVIISNTVINNKTIPSDICLSSVILNNGKYVTRIYDINSNPKEILSKKTIIFNSNHVDILKSEFGKSLWEANIYPIGKTIDESVENALLLYNIITSNIDDKEIERYQKFEKISLSDSFLKSNTKKMLEKTFDLEKKILIDKIFLILKMHGNLNKAKLLIEKSSLKDEIIDILKLNNDKKNEMRRYYLLSMLENSNYYLTKSFESIGSNLQKLNNKGTPNFIHKKIEISNPVRINFGGGWSDTPPYCMENGGCVLNVAVKVNNCYPINVIVEKLKDKKLIFSCIDFNDEIEINNIDDIRKCNNPNDSYALLKCAVVISELIKENDVSLNDLFNRINCGIKITTNTIMIPRGSGLGTSSILSGTVLEAIYKFMNLNISKEELCYDVLRLEQLMSTGGGWQDQVGGLIPGFKLITTEKGNEQYLNIEKVNISVDTKNKLNKRLLLINTAERRLARNLLRDIMGKYILGDEKLKNILEEIQVVAKNMKLALEEDDVDEFANLLNYHWELSKQLDKGCTNTCIDFIFESVCDLISAKFICGAGGGGFLVVLLKENVNKEEIDKRLNSIFADIGVDTWSVEII